jgi:hypothetical protein
MMEVRKKETGRKCLVMVFWGKSFSLHTIFAQSMQLRLVISHSEAAKTVEEKIQVMRDRTPS